MKFKILIFLVIIGTLSSCFEVVEDITINQDNSGTFKITANFSKSASTLKTIMALDSAFGISIPQQKTIEENLIKAKNKLESMAGVSNVTYHSDYDSYLFDISYSFNNQKILNKSFLEVAKLFDKNSTLPYTPFEFDNNYFTRNHQTDLTTYQTERAKTKFSDILEKANYITVYRLNKEVQSVSNTTSIIAKNKTTVVNRIKIGELLFQPNKLTNTIKYK